MINSKMTLLRKMDVAYSQLTSVSLYLKHPNPNKTFFSTILISGCFLSLKN
jgi:hypothetical protein